MGKANRTKTAATPVAQTKEEATRLVARIGEIQRELSRKEADHGDTVAKLQEEAEADALPLKQELETALARVQGYCEANRAELTVNNSRKFAALATGVVKWRSLPPSVKLKDVKGLIDRLLKSRKLKRFVRVKHEVNKEALLAEPEVAATIVGVTVNSDGEEFVVEPFEVQLQAAAS